MFLPIVGMGLGIYGSQHCFTARRCKGTSQEIQSQFYSQPFTNCSQSVHIPHISWIKIKNFPFNFKL